MNDEYKRKFDRVFKSWQFRISALLTLLMATGAGLAFCQVFFFGAQTGFNHQSERPETPLAAKLTSI